MPFEVLMEHVAALTPEDEQLPLGALAERWGEPSGRICDAIDALKVLRGQPSYISVQPVPGANGVTTGTGGTRGGRGEAVGYGGPNGVTGCGGGGGVNPA